ncbi:MAG TPA: hypothetical protein VLO09_03125 [Ornithinimicrobium sp.]|nr:hypothetical protein [Ornithinimicrobium sp.]
MGDIGPVGRRQFLLTRTPVQAPPGFHHQVHADWHLYTCPGLPTLRATGPAGRPRVLLGVATGTAPGAGDPGHQLRTLGPTELEPAYRSWSGRWVLLDGSEIHQDALGMLPVLHRRDRVASAPPLVAPGAAPPDLGLRTEHMMPYLPGPQTGLDGVLRLLPGQVLDLRTGSTRPRALVAPQEVGEDRAEDVLERLGELLLAAVRGAAEVGPLVVPLTAGYDSRLALAASVRLGLRPRLVTQLHPGMSTADRRSPAVMAQRLGLVHEAVRPGPRDRGKGRLYDEQVGGLIRETDRTFFERGQFDCFSAGDVLLRGVAFDGTRAAMQERLADAPLDAAVFAVALGATPVQQRALAEWVRTVRADPQGMSVHDRFWLDQKCASYAATTELALDLVGVHSVLPGNSADYQAAALSLPWTWRRASRHHTELVARWAPQIADIPYNPPLTRVDRWRRLGGTARRRGRSLAARLRRQDRPGDRHPRSSLVVHPTPRPPSSSSGGAR